jgi:non-heme chloroperoxidase
MVHFAPAALAPLMSFGDVTLANGVRLHYVEQGGRRGPAIVLLHGYSDSSLSFSRVMPLMPAEWRVVAPDLRGHGDSDRPAGGYRMTDFADDVIQLMEALNIPSAVVVGHSMGSFVAQALIERAPQRVAGLVLLGSAPVPTNTTIEALTAAVNELTDPVDAAFVREFQYSTIAQPVPGPFMEAAIANSLRMPSHIWKKVISGMMAFQPASPRSSVRTLVLGGTRDTVFSVAEQTSLARQFPFARLRLFDGVGHTLHWEQPEIFVRELRRFVR